MKRKSIEQNSRNEKLAASFPGTLSYAFEKISEGLRLDPLRSIAIWGIDQVKASLNSFREALTRRGISISTYPGIETAYSQISYPLYELEEYLNLRASEIASADAGNIFTWYLHEKVFSLRDMAADLDREYENTGHVGVP